MTTVGALLLDNALPHLERTVLLAHALGLRRESVLAHPEMCVPAPRATEFRDLVGRRLEGQPIAYLVGEREFFGLKLAVTADVLIPRPDTELLVEAALQRLPASSPGRVLDLGTGSGAVAIAIARHRPALQIDAFDISSAAVALAASNARRHAIPNIAFLQSDWYAACPDQSYDVIVSNPPYIPAADPHMAEGDVRFEPGIALTPGPDGLEAIRAIATGAIDRLSPGGWLLFEHGYDQAAPCRQLMMAAGFDSVTTYRDLAGIERVCEGRRPGIRAS